jgi:Ca2+-transporting ATPase
METLLDRHWHYLPLEEVVDLLESHPERGLDIFEVKHRWEHFGANLLTPPKRKSPLVRFLLQFNNPLIYILLAGGAITAALRDWVDAAVIFAVVLVNAVIGFVQEAKAEKAIEALAQTMAAKATVVRAGKKQEVPAAELVPGDLVLLRSGDKVPADIRLVRSRDLQVAEAALTGESLPVQKEAEVTLAHDTGLADRRNMAYASTLVTSGEGAGLVVATGDATEVGRISQLVSTAKGLETPLIRKIHHFSRVLLFAILSLAGVAFLTGLLRGQPAIELLIAAIALAVAAIPEGLPAAVTVTLAIGVTRMARRHAIIRKLPAVETLGSTTVICSDKTGTLTQNQMTVQRIFTAESTYELTGGGYAPSGQILRLAADGKTEARPDSDAALLECLKAGLLCNDSGLVERAGRWEVQGDPTEGALIVAARKAGLSPEELAAQLPRIDAIPFESEHKYMATLHNGGAARPRAVYLKGAVEVVLPKCSAALGASGQTIPLDVDKVHQAVEELAAQGLRVLAFARGEQPQAKSRLAHADLASGLTFLGPQGMSDPPRPEAIAAVRTCQSAGIQVKMITGDHALTAAAIAEQLGLNNPCAGLEPPRRCVLTGQEMAELDDEQLIPVAEETAVFARVSPEQKLRLVEALQARGHVVAVTGDGVNDAPALKQADIGVAMGLSGTEVAKEAADMVLTDDNFASIEAAVEEGRGVFDNLTKFITWTLPTNLGEGLIVLTAIFLGALLPILPAQILWINMTTALFLGATLALEPKEPDIMSRRPRDPRAPILSRALVRRIMLLGALILIGAFGLFEWEQLRGASLAQARTVAVNVVVMVELLYLFNCRSLSKPVFRLGLFSNPWAIAGASGMVLLQLAFTYAPLMNRLFSSSPIRPAAWGWIAIVSIFSYITIEFEKWLARRRAGREVR